MDANQRTLENVDKTGERIHRPKNHRDNNNAKLNFCFNKRSDNAKKNEEVSKQRTLHV